MTPEQKALNVLVRKLRTVIQDLQHQEYGSPEEVDTDAFKEDLLLLVEEYEEEMRGLDK